MNAKIFIGSMIAFLIIGAGIISLAIPAYGEHCWYSFSDITAQSKKYPFLDSGRGAMAYFFSIFKEYRLNCDKGFIPLIADFPAYYAQGAPDSLVYLNRPLYPALASIVFRVARFFTAVPDFILSFASALAVNYFFAFAAAYLLYFLIQRFFTPRIAFMSVILFIFSPFFHIFINQPIAEMASAFIVVASLAMLAAYSEKPSPGKLIAYSLVFGCLMLGKMIYALAFFIVFLAWHFKRWKEGVIFLALQSVPVLAWLLTVRYALNMPYYIHEISYGDATAAWLFNILTNPWHSTAFIVINSIPHFITNTVYGFLLAPLIAAWYGFYAWDFPHKRVVVFGYIAAFFLLSFVMIFWQPRLSFLMFPMVYPLTALGLHGLKDRWGSVLFYAAFMALIGISTTNIYHLVNYG